MVCLSIVQEEKGPLQETLDPWCDQVNMCVDKFTVKVLATRLTSHESARVQLVRHQPREYQTKSVSVDDEGFVPCSIASKLVNCEEHTTLLWAPHHHYLNGGFA